MLLHIPYLLFVICTLFACKADEETAPAPAPTTEYQEPVVSAVLPMIQETSGIADSKNFPGYLWAHEDSGTPAQLHLIRHDGKVETRVILKDAYNRDWEEMAISGGDIFIADIGDNRQVQENYWIYQFPEPGPGVDTVTTYKTILFKYPDSSHDAEAFLVDPETRDIYIITKRDDPSRLYKLTYPYSDTSINTPIFLGTLAYTGIVGAAMSADGQEIILKTYPEILLYSRKAGESLENLLLKGTPESLNYQMEPQGEAIAFANDNSGIFTLSEKAFSTMVNLFFYPRK